MIKLTTKATSYMKSLRDIQVRLIIPVSVTDNFTLGYLVSSDGTTLASLEWLAQYRQVVMVSSAPKEDTTGNSFAFMGMAYANSRYSYIASPYCGNTLSATLDEIVAFSSNDGEIDTSLNILNNNATMIINNCTVTNAASTEIVSFDLSLTYTGDQATGSNLLLLQADSLSIDKPKEEIKPRGRRAKAGDNNETSA